MELYQHDSDFTIRVNGKDLMLSRNHESELELARLGCAHLLKRRDQTVLIGGLGMGYTLRQTLDMLSPRGHVVVAEIMNEIIDWNRSFLGSLNGQPLEDHRVEIRTIDITELLSHSKNTFGAILLDIDNGPSAMTYRGNSRLYSYEGILSCRRALRDKGCLAVWSAVPSKEFEQLLMSCNFHVSRFRVQAHKGSKSRSCFVWIASENKKLLPPGGGEPRQPGKRATRARRSHRRT